VELGACFAFMAGDHCLGGISAHYRRVMDLGIILADDIALVGNRRIGGMDAAANIQFDQREVVGNLT